MHAWKFSSLSKLKNAIAVTLMTVLMALSLNAQTEVVLHAFTNGDGASPASTLTPDGKGNFFGVTALGGNFSDTCEFVGCGNVFELSPNPSGGWTETVIYTFRGSDGANPEAAVTIDGNGNLYGTTVDGGYFGNSGCTLVTAGCGVVYKLSPNADGSFSQSVLYRFRGGKDGFLPQTQVLLDRSGNMFGTANLGGTHSVGTVFQLSPNATGGWTFELIYTFNKGMDGARPGGFAMDGEGNLFVSTPEAGITAGPCASDGCGTILELSPTANGGWARKIVHAFTGKMDGAVPLGLNFDANGNLFGAALSGGHTHCSIGPVPGCGVIFRLTQVNGHWKENTLYAFKGGIDGATPRAAPTFDAAGNLYGTSNAPSYGECPGNCGAVYELLPSSAGWTESTLYVFSGGTDGGIPDTNGVALDSSGNLLGTTELGGIAADCNLGFLPGCGVIYEISR